MTHLPGPDGDDLPSRFDEFSRALSRLLAEVAAAVLTARSETAPTTADREAAHGTADAFLDALVSIACDGRLTVDVRAALAQVMPEMEWMARAHATAERARTTAWTADTPDDRLAAVRLSCGHARLVMANLGVPGTQSRTWCDACGTTAAALRYVTTAHGPTAPAGTG